MRKINRIIGGVLLVSGTAVGAGMLALPVSTGLAGFFPASLLMLICWLYMTFTAFLMLESTLSMPQGANLVSIAREYLGRWGAALSWVIYLFLLYALTTAYIAGSGPIIDDLITNVTGYAVPKYVGQIPLLLLLGLFVYVSTASVDWINRVLMLGLTLSYFVMVVFLAPEVNHQLLTTIAWKPLMFGASVVVTSFGFHIIIPTLCSYLERDVKALKVTLIIGSIIPLIVYLVWQYLALGIIPIEGPYGITEGYIKGENAASLISGILDLPGVELFVQLFSCFAILTSYLGVSLSLSHFLADGFEIKETPLGKFFLYLMTFVPPLLITFINPRAFLSALEYAGAFGVIILLGLFPALMAWRRRYHLNSYSSYKAPGGKVLLSIIILLSLLVVGLEVAIKMNIITN